MSDLSAPTHLIEVPEIKDAFQFFRKVHNDDRGFFYELAKESVPGLPKFVQQNTSFSFGGVLRGMHAMKENPQGKLVSCLYGTVLDVIFDIRKDSPTFGKGFSALLEFDKGNSLYAPPGVLHGFLAMSRFAVVHYSCTTEYNPGFDAGVHWESPEIKEFFPEDISPIVSPKDQGLPSLREYLEQLK